MATWPFLRSTRTSAWRRSGDQLAFAATYPDEAFSRYGTGQELIAEVKAWALKWSTEIGLDIADSESRSDDENY